MIRVDWNGLCGNHTRKVGEAYDLDRGSIGSNCDPVVSICGNALEYHQFSNPYVQNYYLSDPLNRVSKVEFEGHFASHPVETGYEVNQFNGRDHRIRV